VIALVTDDRRLAAQMAFALLLLRKHLEGRREPLHPLLAALEREVVGVLRSEHLCTEVNGDRPAALPGPYAQTDGPEYLTPKEYASAGRVHVGSVYRWVRDGSLQVERCGRLIRIPRNHDHGGLNP